MTPINLNATRETFPGGFYDRAAAAKCANTATVLEAALFGLENICARLRKLAERDPGVASLSCILAQYIEDGISDSAIRHVLATMHERLAQFEEGE